MPVRKGTRRKRLRTNKEEFFEAALLLCGPPESRTHHEAPMSVSWRRTPFVGTSAWIRYDPEGQKFTKLLMEYGEAKSRATNWYIMYLKWWNARTREPA